MNRCRYSVSFVSIGTKNGYLRFSSYHHRQKCLSKMLSRRLDKRHYHPNALRKILYTHIRVLRRHQLPIKASTRKPWSLGKVLKPKYFCFVLRLWWRSKSWIWRNEGKPFVFLICLLNPNIKLPFTNYTKLVFKC